MKKLAILCIMFLSLGASAQNSYKVRKTYTATYNRTTGGYDYDNSTYPEQMYVTFITSTHFKINDRNHSEYWTGEVIDAKDDTGCTTFLSKDEKDETMGVRACNVEGTKTITLLYSDRYYIIYYLEDK